jgi:hypothetical protein
MKMLKTDLAYIQFSITVHNKVVKSIYKNDILDNLNKFNDSENDALKQKNHASVSVKIKGLKPCVRINVLQVEHVIDQRVSDIVCY